MKKQSPGYICVKCGIITSNPKGSCTHPFCEKCFKEVFKDDEDKFLEWYVEEHHI